MPAVSVVIRAKDEAAGIAETLSRLRAQTVPADAVQLIVVDSGSRDRTVDIARAAGADVHRIPPESFTFGGSLNFGCALATAPIVIALSAHAFPPDERWLARLLHAFEDEAVACACGDDYGPDGGPLRERVRQDEQLARRNPHWGYSNAAGAFRLDLWRQRAFRPDMPGTEDKEWAWWWLRRGHACVVDPDFAVEHDHSKDPLREIYIRNRREWVGYQMFLDPADYSVSDLVREWWRQRGTYRSMTRARLSHRRTARLLGKYAGCRKRALRAQYDAASARPPTPAPPAEATPVAVPQRPLRLAVMVDRFPVRSETFVTTEVAALRALGHQVNVEAVVRAEEGSWVADGDAPAAFVTDERRLAKLADLLWLVAHHPLACAADVRAQRGWKAEEEVAGLRALAGRAHRAHRRSIEHLHVHFATRSALEAMRIGRILGLPYSVTAHAYEIFSEPANLRQKLSEAAVVSTGCDYNVSYLRELLGEPAADRVHEVVMGVDPGAFSRSAPLPGGRTVVGVGRLVPKKGFEHLVLACALLHRRAPLDAVIIAGEGPMRERLTALAREHGIAELLQLPGALGPEQVRALLQRADVLAMPAVVAADGDRDSMPVVVKEAMAMELLVAASDEVGLPEIVHAPWGRLAPPGDPGALADALDALLALDPAARAQAGRAGRGWVLEHANAQREAQRLVGLIRAAAAAKPSGA